MDWVRFDLELLSQPLPKLYKHLSGYYEADYLWVCLKC